jgi:acetyl esterase/lipase
MQQIELELEGGGVLTVSLRASLDAMPAVKERPLVLVVPGGGYDHVSPREGDPVALQFAAAGYHTAVLTYSVGEGAQNYRPLRQLNEALALLRQNAGEWHILPDKIAVCGFSADIWPCPPRC